MERVRRRSGYKELKPYFFGEMALEEALENLKRATRRYAKRRSPGFAAMSEFIGCVGRIMIRPAHCMGRRVVWYRNRIGGG